MREKLNSNPLAQVAVVGVLLLLAGVFVLSSMGGGGDSGQSTTTSATVSTPAGTASVTATVTPSSTATDAASLSSALPSTSVAPPIPHPVVAAWAANETVVLLFVRDGGIDDHMVAAATDRLSSMPGVVVFVVPAHRIARYAAIAQGVKINRVPALVVMRPKRLDKGGIPTASVHYGFQSPQSVVQAVIDAGYKGRTVTYYP